MRTTRYRRQDSNTWLPRCCAGAAGGPQKYTGKDMESSHRHLRITSGEWDAFMDDVAQTLDKFAVPLAERAEVVAIIESTRRSIVAA